VEFIARDLVFLSLSGLVTSRRVVTICWRGFFSQENLFHPVAGKSYPVSAKPQNKPAARCYELE
jgi:hypothetical protein